MDEQTEAILMANDNFYRALSLADFSAMQRLWLASPDAVCLHPGWPALHGWEAIRESWKSIFKNQGPLHVWASEAQVRIYNQTAEVTCLENIDTGQVAGAGVIQTRATNVFRLMDNHWKLLEHHAVPLPPGSTRQTPERFSPN